MFLFYEVCLSPISPSVKAEEIDYLPPFIYQAQDLVFPLTAHLEPSSVYLRWHPNVSKCYGTRTDEDLMKILLNSYTERDKWIFKYTTFSF